MVARDASGKWLPGQTGNPGGKPAVIERVRELAREQTEASIAALVQIRDDRRAPAQARVAAAVSLLDRGWGKPQQMIVAEVTERFAFQFPAEAASEEEWLMLPPPDTTQ